MFGSFLSRPKNQDPAERPFSPQEQLAAEHLKWWTIFLKRELRRMEGIANAIQQTSPETPNPEPSAYDAGASLDVATPLYAEVDLATATGAEAMEPEGTAIDPGTGVNPITEDDPDNGLDNEEPYVQLLQTWDDVDESVQDKQTILPHGNTESTQITHDEHLEQQEVIGSSLIIEDFTKHTQNETGQPQTDLAEQGLQDAFQAPLSATSSDLDFAQ